MQPGGNGADDHPFPAEPGSYAKEGQDVAPVTIDVVV
ncbi:hypothetical protein SAMN05192541_14539 [Bradyrhizobium arachidis]|nr:hypothetical protein SAMN05192541_14539 [Bradyrhizobium arachidis]